MRRRSPNFGATWWGRAWVRALEGRARLDTSRLPRGRSYARENRVADLAVGPGGVDARVQGRQRAPYDVRLGVRELTADEWDALVGAIAGRAGHAAALFAGELHPEIVDDAASVGVDLLPDAGELTPSCTCADWADPCKHAAAVCYLVADLLDDDPFELFHLRGKTRRELLSSVRAARRAAATDAASEAGSAAGAGRGGAVSDEDQGEGDDEDLPPSAGVVARDAYTRSQTTADDLWALDVVTPPEQPGIPARAAIAPPAHSGVQANELHRLAADAARRAWGLAIGAASSGLDLDLDEDLGRITSSVLGTPMFATLADRSGVPRGELAALGIAWEHGEREGVQVTVRTWPAPEDWIDEGRRALEGAAGGGGADRPVGWRVTAEHNRLDGRGIQLRVGPSGLWYRFVETRGSWQLDGPPSPDPAVLIAEL